MKPSLIASCGSLVALLCCTRSESSGGGGAHEPGLPVVTVKLDGPSEIATVWATVEAVPAPDVEFLALIRPDRNHISHVAAPRSGVLTRVQPQRHAHRRDTLAVLGLGSEVAGREVTIVAMQDGTWLPLRRPTQFVLQEDTIGVIEEHGYWLALGTIADIDAGVFHKDDATVLRFAGDRHTSSRRGTVEWVRRGAISPYSADVAVEFRAPEGAFDSQPGPVTVIVTPGSDDSVAAVPASAVVQLPPGPAVFVPLGLGRYEVRWVSTGPSVGGKIVVREGVKTGTSVVAQGLARLVEAARDSLERRAGLP